jgi:hypothetical protein
MGCALSLHALVVLLALTVGTIIGGVFGAILAVPYTAVAWAVIQVWTNRYQTGHDPVLGDDPLDPQDRVSAKASLAQRVKYHRMKQQQQAPHPHGGTRAPANRKLGIERAAPADQVRGHRLMLPTRTRPAEPGILPGPPTVFWRFRR